MATQSLTIESNLKCKECNADLSIEDVNYDKHYNAEEKQIFTVYVLPCPKCLELAKAQGIVEGMDRAVGILKKPVEA